MQIHKNPCKTIRVIIVVSDRKKKNGTNMSGCLVMNMSIPCCVLIVIVWSKDSIIFFLLYHILRFKAESNWNIAVWHFFFLLFSVLDMNKGFACANSQMIVSSVLQQNFIIISLRTDLKGVSSFFQKSLVINFPHFQLGQRHC